MKRGRNQKKLRQKRRYLQDNPYCVICGKKADTIDHIIPVSKGGRTIKENYQSMCQFHNQQKGDKLPEEF